MKGLYGQLRSLNFIPYTKKEGRDSQKGEELASLMLHLFVNC